jgi:hypothetical protein
VTSNTMSSISSPSRPVEPLGIENYDIPWLAWRCYLISVFVPMLTLELSLGCDSLVELCVQRLGL